MVKAMGFISFLFVLSSPLCAQETEKDIPNELKRIQNVQNLINHRNFSAQVNEIRPRSIREVAETIGIQSGAKWRYSQIIKEIELMRSTMDVIYDFRPYLLHQNKVMPPIVTEAKGTKGITELGRAIQESKRTYVIETDARVVLSPPSWEDYLYRSFTVNSDVNPALIPEDDTEQAIWDQGAASGWEIGVKQADREFTINLNKLTRDIKGINLFHQLSEQKIMSVPILAEGKFGVTVDGKVMDIDHRVFRLTTDARFNQTVEWITAVGGHKE